MSKKTTGCCETCINNAFDDEAQEYVCMAAMDEDELYRMMNDPRSGCPYYRSDDDYAIVRKQN